MDAKSFPKRLTVDKSIETTIEESKFSGVPDAKYNEYMAVDIEILVDHGHSQLTSEDVKKHLKELFDEALSHY